MKIDGRQVSGMITSKDHEDARRMAKGKPDDDWHWDILGEKIIQPGNRLRIYLAIPENKEV